MTYRFLGAILLISFFVGCKNSNASFGSELMTWHRDASAHHKDHWTYEGETGPDHWAELEKNSECSGQKQSPVNIIDVDAVVDTTLAPLDIFYCTEVKIHDIMNNGHTVQYNFDPGDYIEIEGKQYDLVQIHFHEASEHTINGIRYPLEMHLVHMSKDKKIAVLAIMAQEGYSSPPFTFLENYLPISEGETKPIDARFDLNNCLPEDRSYYTYQGSLTTPPCTENVRWYVFKNAITISLDQVVQLQKMMPLNNYRNVQPLNGRVVKKISTG